MKITIDNVKCYATPTEYSFKSGEATLLSAPSGSGKSTVFQCVRAAIWGARTIPGNFCTRANTKSSIRLEDDFGNVIVRTWRPGTVSLMEASTGKKYKGSDADARLVELYGPSDSLDHYEAVSLVSHASQSEKLLSYISDRMKQDRAAVSQHRQDYEVSVRVLNTVTDPEPDARDPGPEPVVRPNCSALLAKEQRSVDDAEKALQSARDSCGVLAVMKRKVLDHCRAGTWVYCNGAHKDRHNFDGVKQAMIERDMLKLRQDMDENVTKLHKLRAERLELQTRTDCEERRLSSEENEASARLKRDSSEEERDRLEEESDAAEAAQLRENNADETTDSDEENKLAQKHSELQRDLDAKIVEERMLLARLGETRAKLQELRAKANTTVKSSNSDSECNTLRARIAALEQKERDSANVGKAECAEETACPDLAPEMEKLSSRLAEERAALKLKRDALTAQLESDEYVASDEPGGKRIRLRYNKEDRDASIWRVADELDEHAETAATGEECSEWARRLRDAVPTPEQMESARRLRRELELGVNKLDREMEEATLRYNTETRSLMKARDLATAKSKQRATQALKRAEEAAKLSRRLIECKERLHAAIQREESLRVQAEYAAVQISELETVEAECSEAYEVAARIVRELSIAVNEAAARLNEVRRVREEKERGEKQRMQRVGELEERRRRREARAEARLERAADFEAAAKERDVVREKTIVKWQKRVSSIEEEITTRQRSIELNKQNWQTCSTDLAGYIHGQKFQRASDDLARAKAEQSRMEQELKEAVVRRDELQAELNALVEWKSAETTWQKHCNYEKRRIELEEKRDQSERDMNHSQERVNMGQLALEAVNAASTKSMAEVLSAVNFELAMLMVRFFSGDEAIRVKLVNTGKRCDLHITHRGIECKANTLSTGEAARVNLAVDLAIRKIMGDAAPIIIDESVANLDDETARRVIETIRKEFAGRTCLYAAHQIDTACVGNNVVFIAEEQRGETGCCG
jgi:ABC-type lipoprotein export system ATPase subunit